MKTLDPYYLLNKVSVDGRCPEDITFIVKWLKAMMLWNDLDLRDDREKMINFFSSWKTPQEVIWSMRLNEEEITRLYDRARDWIMRKETLDT